MGKISQASTVFLMSRNISVLIAFIVTVFIWSTTPLAILWSSLTVHPAMAAFLRMFVAAVLGLIIIWVARIPFVLNRSMFMTCFFATFNFYGAMFASYVSATYISSGFMSVLFGFSPVVTGLLAQWVLQEKGLNRIQWTAIMIAILGLAVIFKDDLFIGSDAVPGVVLMGVAVLLFSLSTVLLKRAAAPVHPLSLAVGGMLLSLPMYLLSWWMMDGAIPVLSAMDKSLWAILYLAILGSLLGFFCFFYLLKHAMAKTSVLVTLVTPVFALMLGYWLNQEVLTFHAMGGALLIVIGLSVYSQAR